MTTNPSLARAHHGTPARTWRVDLSPRAALVALVAGSRFEERALSADGRSQRETHQGTVFYERVGDDALVLWQRPLASSADMMRGIYESIPYPDALHLRASRVAGETRVEATWQTHPATTRAAWQSGVGLALMMLGLVPVSWLTGSAWMLLLIFGAAALPLSRFRGLRKARRSLLAAAYEAIATYELGAGETEVSAFREQRRLPPVGVDD